MIKIKVPDSNNNMARETNKLIKELQKLRKELK